MLNIDSETGNLWTTNAKFKELKVFHDNFRQKLFVKNYYMFDLRSKKKRFFSTSENIIYRMADTDICKLHWYFYTSKYLNNIFITR